MESTWTMDHLVHHNPPQRAIFRRDLRTNHTVEVVAAQETEAALQDDEDVGVRQAALLPLHRHQVALDFTKNPLLHQLVDQPLQPLLEDAGHQVRSVIGCLTGQQIILYMLFFLKNMGQNMSQLTNFPMCISCNLSLYKNSLVLNLRPFRVTSEGDKEVGLPQLPNNGHPVLVELLQIARAPRKLRPKNDAPTKKSMASIQHEN